VIAADIFHPVEGAVLDLESLSALSGMIGRVWDITLRRTQHRSLILEGLELEGDWAPAGPPGTVRPEARSTEAVLSPGTALVRTEDGRSLPVEVRQPMRIPWPTSSGPAGRGVLVLVARPTAATSGSGLRVARQKVNIEVGFVRQEQAEVPWLLPVAQPVGNSRDWILDLARVFEPEHPAIELLLKRLDLLDQTIWRAEPEGSVWDRQVLGRNWVRYQTVAAAALQAARMTLRTQALTTRERVRLVGALFDQLHGSVQRAANELLQGIGRPDAAGPYAEVARRLEESA
jgi:hypothetical protein